MQDNRTQIAIAIVEREGHFLVGRRPENVPLAGFWEFPGGKVEPNELPEQAVVRECAEEAGIFVEVMQRYSICDYEYDHGKLKLHFFSCRPVGRTDDPKGSFRWVCRDDLRELEFPSANRALIELLTEQRGTTSI